MNAPILTDAQLAGAVRDLATELQLIHHELKFATARRASAATIRSLRAEHRRVRSYIGGMRKYHPAARAALPASELAELLQRCEIGGAP